MRSPTNCCRALRRAGICLGIHHVRFHPDAEAQTAFDRFGGKRRQTVRQTRTIRLPVAQSGLVIRARIFIAEPAVIQQELLLFEPLK